MTPPAELSRSSKDWATFTAKRRKSFRDASRHRVTAANEGRAVDAREHHLVATDVNVVRRVASLHVELGRHRVTCSSTNSGSKKTTSPSTR